MWITLYLTALPGHFPIHTSLFVLSSPFRPSVISSHPTPWSLLYRYPLQVPSGQLLRSWTMHVYGCFNAHAWILNKFWEFFKYRWARTGNDFNHTSSPIIYLTSKAQLIHKYSKNISWHGKEKELINPSVDVSGPLNPFNTWHSLPYWKQHAVILGRF